MKPAHILLADDNPDMIGILRRSLLEDGHLVITAGDGQEALAVARCHQPDLVILDMAMPGLDGLQVCHMLRQDPRLDNVPILFLTGCASIDDCIQALDSGGDDYLIKPFDLRELQARVRALLRRGRVKPTLPAPPPAPITQISVGGITLDLHTCQVRRGTEVVQLTPAEFELLHYLMGNPNKVFSSQELLKQVWGYTPDSVETSLVRWHVMNLRAKIEPDPAKPSHIRTVPRHGYLFHSS